MAFAGIGTNDRGVMMARYGLARHVFVCADEEYVVVLDVKQDRYFTLEAARTAALAPLLPGWPARLAGGSSGDGPELTADEAAAPLLRQGWLLELPAASKEATPVRLTSPQTELLGDTATESSRIGVRAVLNFVFAAVFAKLSLRFWRFERLRTPAAAHSTSRVRVNSSTSLDVCVFSCFLTGKSACTIHWRCSSFSPGTRSCRAGCSESGRDRSSRTVGYSTRT
jgi:hypothetical protein